MRKKEIMFFSMYHFIFLDVYMIWNPYKFHAKEQDFKEFNDSGIKRMLEIKEFNENGLEKEW